MNIKWLGHASVLITADSGMRIITDPYKPGYAAPTQGALTYSDIKESADIIVVTHEHPDHNNVAVVKGSPEIVRGSRLRLTGPVMVRGITFNVIPCYHDSVEGNLLGENNMILFEIDGLKICHTGDIGHRLTNEQILQVGKMDILLLSIGLLVPVGEPRILADKPEPENFTYDDYIIDADIANQLYDQLTPKVIIPIHYSNTKCSYKLASVDEFLKGKKNVRRLDNSEINLEQDNLQPETEIIVLEPAL